MDTTKIESAKTKIIAHRGLSGIERENTCSAFVAAANRSYFGIETDIHITKDGKFIVIHDETTERVTLGKYNINVETSNFSDVENIILPDLDGTTSRADIRIPLLEDYVKICKKYNKICVLEVKKHFELRDLKRMTEQIKALGYIEKVIFISFNLKNCINLKKILPNSNVQWLIGDIAVDDDILQILCGNKLDIDIYYKQLTADIVKMFHLHGIKVNCWTCDNKDDAEKLVSFGVDFLTTNILE